MKKNSAFTLIEVMLAMGVLTVSVFFVSEILFKALTRLQDNNDNIEKTFILKRELYLNYFKRPFITKKIVTKLEDPSVTFATTLEDVNKKSGLKEFQDTLKIIQTNAVWKKEKNIKESNMLSFIFKPKEKEVKK